VEVSVALVAGALLLLATTSSALAHSPSTDNERQIAANKTATAATHATFEAQNAGAIARRGAAEPTSTPGPTWTATPTGTPVPAPPAPTDTPTDEPSATPVPCAMQFSWQLVVDDQGDPITQLDDSGQVLGLWQDDQGEQTWAPTTLFCVDSADSPTPGLTSSDTPLPTDPPTPRPTTAPVPPAPAPAARHHRPPLDQLQRPRWSSRWWRRSW
jgi:hypothetical protein